MLLPQTSPGRLQGKTLKKIILSLGARSFKPHLSLTSLLMMYTRVPLGCDVRTIGFDSKRDRQRFKNLHHPPMLDVWNAAYDAEGRYNDALALAAAKAAIARRAAPATAAGKRKQPPFGAGPCNAACSC